MIRATLSRAGGMIILSLVALFHLSIAVPDLCHALCATVKIEIRQELTLERQAFDAHMRINNGLSHIPIEDVAVTVNFADEAGNPILASSNPDDTGALFFIRIDSMENIDDVGGSGIVAPETSADIHWLIIPAPGASNGLESGTLYYVGATLTYTAAGQTEAIEVTPDYIFVKPMPQLVLDYFLPTDVYGDDAWSSAVEPPVPFSLGLRVSNKGHGYARSLKVESAQPKIVENQMGLLIGFQIDGSTVNGQPASDSLLVDFGDIAPNSAGTARWIMSCTLSGRFTEFSADFSHADELGGKMTSLIAEDDVRTHFLVHDVLVDAPGRDAIEDFLAKDDDVFRIYESDSTQTDVTDQSAAAALSAAQGNSRQLSIPATAGFVYAQVTDPYNGNMLVKEAIRSDGKRIKNRNIWLSKTRAGSGPWQYFINLFDYNTPGEYTLVFQSSADLPQPPVIMYIPERTRVEGQQLSFLVEASDPNGTVPLLAAERLPVGATFIDQGDGSGVFDWTPAAGQAGRYAVRFIASDGVLESSRQAVMIIFSQDDTDGDGMLDSWEMEHFGTLDRDGSGDFDADGICDLDEWLNGLDPESSDSVPSVPEIVSPQNGGHVDQLSPSLEIANSIDPEGDAFSYVFEIYSDKEYKTLVASQADVIPQSNTTVWMVPVTLDDNTAYFWRVKAVDATGSSNWAHGRFFVDTQNDPPSAPVAGSPADSTSVDTQTPILQILNSTDPDSGTVTYRFELYADSSMQFPVASMDGIAAGANGRTSWTVDVPLDHGAWYYWRAIAADELGAHTPGLLTSFQVDLNNSAPSPPEIVSPADESEITTTSLDLTAGTASDAEGGNLTYLFEIDTRPTFDSPDRQISNQILPMDQAVIWAVQNLNDNTRYYWRVKANDGLAESPWRYGAFLVNTINEAPPAPVLKNPGVGAWVNTPTPALSVHPVSDIDTDELTYRFELYTDPQMTQPAGYTEAAEPAWSHGLALKAGTWYYWRVQAVDQHGIAGPWSENGRFFIKLNGINLPPELMFLEPSETIATNAQGIVIHWIDTDPDSNAAVSLYYDTDNTGEDGIVIATDIEEDPDGTADYHTWNISDLEGIYYIYATISDTLTSRTVYNPVSVTVDHTAPSVTAEPAGATYDAALNVVLSADETAQIYYTLDGSEPTIGSAVYQSALPISEDTTLKFMAVDSVGNQSATATEAYSFAAADITVAVSTDKGRDLQGVRVYAFTAANAYTGKSATSDGSGQAHFNPADFSAGNYKFRVDYLGRQFWSGAVALPDTRAVPVVIAEEPVTVTVNTAAGPAAGVRVYLFSASGSYLGIYLITDANGQVGFDLPVGVEFTFRADLYGNMYWSPASTVAAGSANHVPVDTGGGLLQAVVNKAADQPLAGIRVYLFNTAGQYLGHNATTDENGRAGFDVPEGDYRLRADYLGYQFWSTDTAVITDTNAVISIPHQSVQVTVETRYQQVSDPLADVPVYLFTSSGSYLGQVRRSDAQGCAVFELPEKAYKVRADYMGRQFWSDEFSWQDPVVGIPMAEARVTVTGAGSALPGVRVYVFSGTNAYLGRNADTDSNGQTIFQLPEGQYRFRADYQDSQFWSAQTLLAADQLQDAGISTGGGSFGLTVLAGQDEPLAGVPCYAFNDSGTYLGLKGTTDSNGNVSFDLADGTYQVRADYLGYTFWTQPVQIPHAPSIELTIDHTPVEVTVGSAAGPVPDVRVYLFRDDGVYQGRYLSTDTFGKALFSLPAGVSYKFRADIMGNHYWSDTLDVPADVPAEAAIDAGGGILQLTVQDDASNPMPDVTVYLFSDNKTYLGQNQVSAADGRVVFDVPDGTYRLRADYLGYSFWTDAVQVIQDTLVTLPIAHQPVTLSVLGHYQSVDTALAAVRVYLFTPTGSYLGYSQETDDQGRVVFNLPQQAYTVRADYMGRQYWSGTFTGQDATIAIPMADAQVSVTGAGLPQAGIPVYLFSDAGTYLGNNAATQADGRVTFHVPAATYRFRADYQGHQYWSGGQALTADQANEVVVSVGGGTFALGVLRDGAAPMPGIRCYVFNASGAYVGLSGSTNDQGQAFFDLSDGEYRFRVDYLGYMYWSSLVTVPAALSAAVQIPHQDVAITLSGRYLGGSEPLSGQRLYLFTPGDTYMGISSTTDAGGQAIFALPDQPYKVRADYLGGQYWSLPFQSRDTSVEIMQGAVDLHVHRNGTDMEGLRVYLFNTQGTYLGRYVITDAGGWAAFILPEGAYRFRVDADGVPYWSPDTGVTADQTSSVEVDVN